MSSYETTKVMLPRFEQEIPDTRKSRPSDTRLVRRTKPRAWLLPGEAETLLSPVNVVHRDAKPRNEKRNWWGVYHWARETIVGEQIFRNSPFSCVDEVYRSRLIYHESLWDEQALSGSETEIVLERRDEAGNFNPEAALLIDNRPFRYKKGELQELVLLQPNGEWAEPGHNVHAQDDWRDYCLLLLGELATRPSEQFSGSS